MDPSSKDIYHKDVPPPLARRRRWFDGRSPQKKPSAPPPASEVYQHATSGRGLRSDPGLHHDHRVRLRRRRSEHAPQITLMNRLLWLGILAVVLLYLLALGGKLLRARHASRSAPPSAAVSQQNAASEPASVASVPAVAQDPIDDDIRSWKSALRLTSEGETAFDKGQIDAARDKFDEALKLAPALTRAQLDIARTLLKKKSYPQAEAMLRQVLGGDPESLSARMALGSVFLASGQYSNALNVARWVLDADSYSVEAHEMAASALLSLNQPADAIVHLRRLVGLNRDDLVAQNNLGAAYMKIHDYRTALMTFRDVLKAEPGNSVAYYNIAVCQALQSKTEEAVATLGEAARKFGSAFVLTWTGSGDFDDIRNNAAFTHFVEGGAMPSVPVEEEPRSEGGDTNMETPQVAPASP